MLNYADKLTRTPWDMTEADLAPLREAGWDDRAILSRGRWIGRGAG